MAIAPNKIRLFLLDDHVLFRESFASLLAAEPDFAVVGQAATAAEALRETVATQPDVILVDLNIPDRDGLGLLIVLRAQVPHAKLLVLTGFADGLRVKLAFRWGARGYLVKTSSPKEVIAGIRSVAGGGVPLSPEIARHVIDQMPRERQPGEGDGSGVEALGELSDRELQVFRLLAEGMSTRETAALLTISYKTVETHRVHIYRKLSCKRPADLTRIAVRAGLVVP